MRTLLILLILFWFVNCTGPKKYGYIQPGSNNTANDTFYRIFKIDSIDRFYLIYARMKDEKFKIVSDKIDTPLSRGIQKIRIGKLYSLRLRRYLDGFRANGKYYEFADVYGHFCYPFSTITYICNEPKKGIYFLNYSNDIKGLYYCR